ncbi:hypothetical protein BN8_03401 [Fibrisoma limi BUZ 3]|uniref:Uncharacterized protein n=1 Tax=Fibrisoma limi BUZ 3 TaxID=1185876 RepID=I2GK24_9BACT|nr:hypothetical protein [Fibrisoma limi]CCH54249.1 hypothetical protein BN8_03401 [Fibrisoma limi BUZ 3]
MKTLLWPLLLLGTLQTPESLINRPPTLKIQGNDLAIAADLAAQLSVPPTLAASGKPALLVIAFRVAPNHQLTDLKIFTDNPTLNHELEQQLRNVRISEAPDNQSNIYQMRLRFTDL